MKIGTLIRKGDILIILLSLLVFFIFAYTSLYIDFHADEAIYYDAIVMNLRNDSGLFYITFYSFIENIIPGVEGARVGSSLLGGLTLLMILNTFKYLGVSQIKNYLLITGVFLISYQSFFLFDRVRPEASWWFITSALFYTLTRLSHNKCTLNIYLVSIFILLLPMNHQLSWFICILLIGYIIIFSTREEGWEKASLFFILIFLGIFLNIYIRALFLNVELIEAIKISFIGTNTGEGLISVKEYLLKVFAYAPIYLYDRAANLNLYEYLFGIHRWTSHAFVQNIYLFLMFVLPFFSKSLKTFYIFSLPIGIFTGFYLSGYFNPTYVPGFTLVILMYLIYFAYYINDKQKFRVYSKRINSKIQYGAYLLIIFSVMNGASFLSTVIFSHDEATYFRSLKKIENIISQNSRIKSIAIPQRFMPAVRDIDIKKYTLFIDNIPKNVDFLIIDDYDYNMYTFAENHSLKLEELKKISRTMCLIDTQYLPVYINDKYSNNGDFQKIKGKNISISGSWFFRNSSTYNLSFYKKCK